MRCRKRRNVTETRLQSLAWDPAETGPAYGLGGDRHKGGVISVLALTGNVGSWSPRCQGKATRGRPPRAILPRRGTGSDQPIVALMPGNAGGAKGLNGSAEGMTQPERGGIHAGSEVVWAARCRDHRATREGRNRWLRPSRTLFPNRWSGRLTRGSRPTRAPPGWTVSPSRRSRPT